MESSNANKVAMTLCLMDMRGVKGDEGATETWRLTCLIEVGSLRRGNDHAYSIFHAIEEVMRAFLQTGVASSLKNGSKKLLSDAILESEEERL